MSNKFEVIAKVLGGVSQLVEVSTVGEARKLVGAEDNMTATMNKEPVNDTTEVTDGAKIVFTPAVKGA